MISKTKRRVIFSKSAVISAKSRDEIGLFLGYPPEDVEGFIENSHECKMSGFWKVYGDVHSAELLFNKYKKCTKVYCEQWKNGKTIERLTVKG